MSAMTLALGRGLLGMNGYQWTVLLAAWLGWGFDVFDGLLFNYVAPNCVPTLLHIPLGTPAAKGAYQFWTGLLAALLLLTWAAGGILFGRVADKIGRTKTLLLTMLLYAAGTACCALAPNMAVLILCRIVAGLGIGGEWAAGASLVAEVVPEERRVEAGALLYTSAPFGLFLATFANHQIAGVWLKSAPEVSWRYVFACGLVAALVAFLMRLVIREPERWRRAAAASAPPRLRELFTAENRALTLSGLVPALITLLTWWSCSTFIPNFATGLAQTAVTADGLAKVATQARIEDWKALATYSFNWGGLLGTLLTIPAAKWLGRRAMFAVYFVLSAAALFATFGLDLEPKTRLALYFFIGLTVFGVLGSFPFYLTELFPTRLRATGAGFCYNFGRIVTAAGPFIVGSVAAQETYSIQHTLFWIGVIPLVGLLLLPLIIETKGRTLRD